MRKTKTILNVLLLLTLAVGIFAVVRGWLPENASGPTDDPDESDEIVPTPIHVSATETRETAADTAALGGRDVLIADRGNNRLIEVTPEKKIVWEYVFDLPWAGLGADDAFFADGGKSIVAGLEEWQTIQVIDVATKKVSWQYGRPGIHGSKDGFLHTPDDPYKLPNGDITVADISNCRIIEISPDKKIVRQYGVAKNCGATAGMLDKPNGDTPLSNGHMLVSNIHGHTLLELDQDWKPFFTMTLPLIYPSDPQLTRAGTILVSGYTDPGKIIEVTKQGKIVWEQAFTSGKLRLKRPSLAIELPNGNILANDDGNHRVIVIDKKTHDIIWQYGVTGKPGRAPGQLNIPDGVDIIDRAAVPLPVPNSRAVVDVSVRGVGEVSRHPDGFSGRQITLRGFVLRYSKAMLIISDEAGGTVGYYDLPVTGPGIDGTKFGVQYVFTGTFVKGGLKAANGQPFHLELIQPPMAVVP